MVNVCGVPTQPASEGVTVMVAVMGALVLFVNVKLLIEEPVPLAARPIAVLELVQVKVVLRELEVKQAQ